jgi:hypothetical protein
MTRLHSPAARWPLPCADASCSGRRRGWSPQLNGQPGSHRRSSALLANRSRRLWLAHAGACEAVLGGNAAQVYLQRNEILI